MNLGISALVFLLMAGCGGNDTIGTGASGWIIGLLLGILLLAAILTVNHRRK